MTNNYNVLQEDFECTYLNCFDGSVDIEDIYSEVQNYYTYNECLNLLEDIKDDIFQIKIENNLNDFYREWLSDLCDSISDIRNHLPPYKLIFRKSRQNKNGEEMSL